MTADIAPIPLLPMDRRAGPAPAWFWTAAGLGVLWNAYGTVQFFNAVLATRESLVAMGMSEVQAQIMSSYPVWMTAAFAAGTLGGLTGSILLLLRQKMAAPVFLASLAGYIVLYIGDITEGIFVALGAGQVAILTLVVAIAAALLWMSKRAAKNGLLT